MRVRSLLFATAAMLALAACGDKEQTLAKGQVVASVEGVDITIHELNAELAYAKMPRDADRKQFEANALQRLIDRKIVARIAREQGLDKTQNFMLQKMRAEDMLLVSMLQRQIVSRAGAPSRADVEAYVRAHPRMFAERTLYSVDQIVFRPEDDSMLKEIASLKTIDQLQAHLEEREIRYRRAPQTVDSAGLDPAMLDQIVKLPAGEVFVVPARGELIANRITDSRQDPLIGEPAVRLATNMLQRERVQELAKRQLDPAIRKARETVRYQKGYEPQDQKRSEPRETAAVK